ncbi:uncharacterized protein LOC110466134 [Mizuhopecten yessoensis]|uniref:Uncharacterized protein n=1 Tax=Mizuhopecten yessoensis TaxID=6573 RepID=A0A210PPY7_MIZYE|nr:uncharacterized protein LOC110466134 [Mizuhopecten yessoensis]OWF38565.1 hypothetical protein KP79_PYT09914 [Mizuhopecten yessoensis]
MGVFGAASMPFIAGVALLGSAILHIVCFISPNWANDGTQSLGLWRYGKCREPGFQNCYKHDHVDTQLKDWFLVVRAMSCLAVIGLSLPLVILPVYMYIALGMYYRRMMAFMSFCSIMATLTIAAAVVVFVIGATDKGWSLEWCFIVEIIAGLFAFIGFVVFLAVLLTRRPAGLKPTYYPSTIHVDPDKPKLYLVQTEPY